MIGVAQTQFNFSRKNKQASIMIFDATAIISSLFIAFFLRLGYFYYPVDNIFLTVLIFTSPLLALPIFSKFGLYREMIRYVGFKSLWHIFQATTLYSILLGLIFFMLGTGIVPRSVVLINWLLVMLVTSSSRLFVHWLLSESNKREMKNVLIYGAGSAGRQLSKALNGSKEYNAIAFIDDNSAIYRNTINGLTGYAQDDI